MPIEWNEQLKTGLPIIDKQHQELLVMLNRLVRFKCGKEDFLDALLELQDYVTNHFKTEEDYMVNLKYPEYEQHKSCHNELAKDINIIYEKIANTENVCNFGTELFHSTENWIINHYSNEDVRLVDYIKKNS